MRKGSVKVIVIIAVVVAVIGLIFLLLSQNRGQTPKSTPGTNQTQQPTKAPASTLSGDITYSSSSKGVVQVESPTEGQEVQSPLTVTGFVYGNNGTLTIKLKQQESGVYVTQDKTVQITGSADKINFAEAIQFGLPAMPQIYILKIVFKDNSGQGLDDSVSVEVNPSGDLGAGL